MNPSDREKWNRQHAAPQASSHPAEFLQQIFLTSAWRIAPGKALDIAAGRGRNSFFLAEMGFTVDAVDISDVAVAEGRRRTAEKQLTVSWQQADLDQIELPQDAYDLVINFNYLQRSLVPRIKTALRSGGHVIFETFLIDQREIGHPKNPDYLLKHNELLNLFRDFRVLCYREGKFLEGGNEAFRAGLLAQRAD